MSALEPPASEIPVAVRRDDEQVRDLRRRLALARLWLFVLLLFGGLLAVSVRAMGKSDSVYWSVMLLTGVFMVGVLKGSRLSARAYGFTLQNAASLGGTLGGALRGTLLSTTLLVALGALAIVIARSLGWLDRSLPLVAVRLDGQTIAYVLLAAPLQELLFRGLFQTAAREIFADGGRGASVAAVSFSTLAFAISHLPWGVETALLMLVPGVIWGIQMERERSLVGVCLSHALVGYLLVGVSPLWALLRGMA